MLKKDQRAKLAQQIIDLIEEHRDPWVKAAFYSDPVVDGILKELYSRWERSNRSGAPLDHASLAELKSLAEKARRYSRMSPGEAQRLVLSRSR